MIGSLWWVIGEKSLILSDRITSDSPLYGRDRAHKKRQQYRQ
ncbi:hypothetical protein [Lusitaniella coriacea]|nr:hypothetical protein [Lusitaniella coriacea]